MKKQITTLTMLITICAVFFVSYSAASEKETIKAIYIPLADHYPGIVAYEKYKDKMEKADYKIERMKSWSLLRAYFMSGEVDMAYLVCPMAMDMFAENPNFRWVSLLHRDGNALAINELLNADVNLPEKRISRKPDHKVAEAFTAAKKRTKEPVECGVPSLLATHTVVLYKYLKDHGIEMNFGVGKDKDVLAIAVPPPESPAFLKKNNARNVPASFEQSLPWADVVETQGFGHVAWYSKDVMPWPNGHVECIAIATDKCIKEKTAALGEVIYYIHQAGLDIEAARRKGGSDMIAISDMIRRHIPEHNQEAIIQSLRPDLNVINYFNLNVDKAGLKQIMDYAVEGGILKKAINIDEFADESFSTKITKVNAAALVGKFSGNADKITEKMQKILEREMLLISKWATDPIVIESVKAQNAKDMSLETIKAIDKEWIAGGQKELVESLQNNKAGLFLREKILSNKDFYTEAFLCDAKGAVTGEYPKTSDYWQGDEQKFTESIIGKVYTGPLLNDESTKSFSVQISVPVMDSGSTIGVLVVGLKSL
ncbi:MAG: ABC transporter substrate-binding protein [Thermodesulfobacteriota bacterium]|nr:ABC transporter substrate-binding protein [Thermodesulfobacteriota bacterium]